MENTPISGETRCLGEAQGYQPLHVRDGKTPEGHHLMDTLWVPSPAERGAIMMGHPVRVRILGYGHPPIRVVVGENDEVI